MKLIYCEYEDCWVWVSLENENKELSPGFDEEIFALEWLFEIETALGHLKNED